MSSTGPEGTMRHRLSSYNDRNTTVVGEGGSTALRHGGRLDLLSGDGAAFPCLTTIEHTQRD